MSDPKKLVGLIEAIKLHRLSENDSPARNSQIWDSLSKLESQIIDVTTVSSKKCSLEFAICLPINIEGTSNDKFMIKFRMQTLSGSLHTYVWNTFARVEDEYSLSFEVIKLSSGKVDQSSGDSYRLWHVHGIEFQAARIKASHVNWRNFQFIRDQLQINEFEEIRLELDNINLIEFAKCFSSWLLSIPAYLRNHHHIVPMPASFMIDYALTVDSCPCIVAQAPDNAFLQGNSSASSIPDCDQHLLKEQMFFDEVCKLCTRGDGAAVWLLNASVVGCPVHHPTNAMEPAVTTGESQHDQTPTSSLSSQSSTATSSLTLLSTQPLQPQVYLTTRVMSLSPQDLDNTGLRVCEVWQNSLGSGGIVMVVEHVHFQDWSKSCRYVVINSELLVSMWEVFTMTSVHHSGNNDVDTVATAGINRATTDHDGHDNMSKINSNCQQFLGTHMTHSSSSSKNGVTSSESLTTAAAASFISADPLALAMIPLMTLAEWNALQTSMRDQSTV